MLPRVINLSEEEHAQLTEWRVLKKEGRNRKSPHPHPQYVSRFPHLKQQCTSMHFFMHLISSIDRPEICKEFCAKMSVFASAGENISWVHSCSYRSCNSCFVNERQLSHQKRKKEKEETAFPTSNCQLSTLYCVNVGVKLAVVTCISAFMHTIFSLWDTKVMRKKMWS